MDLVLGLSILGAATAAFFIGYFLGKIIQANEDKHNVYDAMTYARYKIDDERFLKEIQANYWEAGASDAYTIIFHQINNVFITQ